MAGIEKCEVAGGEVGLGRPRMLLGLLLLAALPLCAPPPLPPNSSAQTVLAPPSLPAGETGCDSGRATADLRLSWGVA